MESRTVERFAWSLWGLTAALAGRASLHTSTHQPSTRDIVRLYAVLVLAGLGYPTVGALIAARFRHNLTGMADRLAALGGSLEVLSSTGSGTKILGLGPAPGYTS
jgi:hypothetical protein